MITDFEFILSNNREKRLIEKAKKLEIEFDVLAPYYDQIEDEIIEAEDKIAHLTSEARSLGVPYTFESDPEELESLIEEAYNKESRCIRQLRSDYISERGFF